ncbi:glycosyltransferase family 4 protein [Neolewinella sp.]|uniref:glycosyltransferase family 4 protein n=1 Tax=Neolewinella sp. TaxID=2993543 RepID=UPI003B51EBC1
MRIICTVTNDLSHDQRMHRICSSLQQAGHQVQLVGRLLPTSMPLPDHPYVTHRLRCRYTSGKLFYLEFNYRLYRYLNRQPVDVICAVDLDTLLPVTLLRSRQVRIVYDAHEWFSETPEVVNRPAIRGFWRQLGRWLVPKTDARYTVAPQLARLLAEDYDAPFSVIRNLPVKENILNKENFGGVILYQGMLNPGRGVETAIATLTLLPECKLWIVGSGPEEESLKRLTATLELTDRVWFAGFHPPAKLPEITAKAWLGINLLADSSPSYYYSLANKALDYIQAGLPSIQMDYPEYRSINEQYGVFELLTKLTAAGLAAPIQRLLDHPEAYTRLRENCRVAAEELCWEREEGKLLKIYSAIEASLPD